MEISDCIWDEGFLCCDDLDVLEPSLVSSSIPSPGLVPFQWSEAPLADEADNSDMTPQCMPVIDPIFVREHFIEDCLIDGVSDVNEVGNDILSGYCPDQGSCEQFSCLHVLVCGFCRSVFHVLEEFKSHLVTCENKSPGSEFNSYDSATAVALVLWTNTVLRRVQESLAKVADTVNLTQRIQARWWRLSKRSRQSWERAAEVLLELGKVGNLVFPAPELNLELRGGDGEVSKDIRWPGPQNIMDADEIEMLGNIKVEEEEEIHSSLQSVELLPANQPSPSPGGVQETSVSEDEDLEQNIESEPCKHQLDVRKTKNQIRDRLGRWNTVKEGPCKSDIYSCIPCDYKTNNQWKLKRHMTSSRHTSRVSETKSNVANEHTDHQEYSNNEEYLVNEENFSQPQQKLIQLYEASFDYRKSKKKVNKETRKISCQRSNIKRKSAISATEKVQAWTNVLGRGRS